MIKAICRYAMLLSPFLFHTHAAWTQERDDSDKFHEILAIYEDGIELNILGKDGKATVTRFYFAPEIAKGPMKQFNQAYYELKAGWRLRLLTRTVGVDGKAYLSCFHVIPPLEKPAK